MAFEYKNSIAFTDGVNNENVVAHDLTGLESVVYAEILRPKRTKA